MTTPASLDPADVDRAIERLLVERPELESFLRVESYLRSVFPTGFIEYGVGGGDGRLVVRFNRDLWTWMHVDKLLRIQMYGDGDEMAHRMAH